MWRLGGLRRGTQQSSQVVLKLCRAPGVLECSVCGGDPVGRVIENKLWLVALSS